MPELKLYNTLSRSKDIFSPFDPNNVRMYVCGPTVYDFAHIGNARPVIVFDLLFRLLRHIYGEDKVTYVRNITDVDDKINKRAFERWNKSRSLNAEIKALTVDTAAQFHADVAALGCLPPTHEPRATDYVCDAAQPLDMVRVIARLIENANAYAAEGHVLFHVPSMPSYGALARRPKEDMLAGARVEVAPYKRDPMDFVLWKPSDPATEPGWESPWGYGRPGWHIECSAMAGALLGETFDIHAGGLDLIFPHHENEIAQSCCAFGVKGNPNPLMAQVWMHNGFLQVEGQKMSKSLGNFRTIREVLAEAPGEVIRFTMLKTHYRQPIDWTMKSLEESKQELLRYAEIIQKIPADLPIRGASTAMRESLCDDLNTAKMVKVLRDHAREATCAANAVIEGAHLNAARLLRDDLALIGFDLAGFVEKIAVHQRGKAVETAQIESLITKRNEARAAKNFAESDRIRAELEAMGITLKDAKDGAGNPTTIWDMRR